MKNPSLSTFERRDQLLRYIEQSRRVSVSNICEAFQISEATARRDLGVLAQQAKIRRIHGGAMSAAQAPQELPVYQRMAEQAETKKRIGRMTANLIAEGDTVFLGSGTTVLEIARALPDLGNLTVISNSLLVLNELIDRPSIDVILLGGHFRRSELSLIGHITEQALDDLRADKVIIGVHAISLENGLTNRYDPETMTDRRILQSGKQLIVVADHTKLGRVSTVFLAPVSAMHTLVTDQQAEPEVVQSLRAQGVRVILA